MSGAGLPEADASRPARLGLSHVVTAAARLHDQPPMTTAVKYIIDSKVSAC